LDYLKQAKLLEQDGVVPEECLYQYEKRRDEAAKSRDAISHFHKRMEDSQIELERAFKNSTSITALAIADRLLKLHDLVTNGEWEPEQEADIASLLDVTKQWVVQEGPRWIERSFCRSPQQVGEYRQMMEKAINTFKALGLTKLAEAAEHQKTYSISTVEERFQFQTIFIEAEQFLAICEILPNQPIAALDAVRTRGEQFCSALEKAQDRLKDRENDEVIVQLRLKVEAAANVTSKHKSDLEQLYESSIDSLDSAKELRSRVDRLREIFHGQRDLSDIEDARKQLEKICSDLEAWLSIERSPKECEEAIKLLNDGWLSELLQWCEEHDVEPLWSFEDVYTDFFKSQISLKKDQAELWLRSLSGIEKEIENISLHECQSRLEALTAHLPIYLSETDLVRVETMSGLLREQIRAIEHDKAWEESRRWIESFSGVKESLATLSEPECRKILFHLEAMPDPLTDAENAEAKNLVLLVENRLDELGISGVLERIMRLKEHQISRLFIKIKSLMNYTE
jgi:hypothetical protein